MTNKPKRKNDPITLLILAAAAIIFLAAGILLVNTFILGNNGAGDSTQFVMTLDPTIGANMTSLPDATPLSAEDAAEFNDFQRLAVTCDDYTAERRSQMLQHIEWLIDPSGIPQDTIAAFGSNVQGTLLYGMANFTAIQWRLLDRPTDSCLVEIGKQLDIMLPAFGQAPLGIYE